jgi:hypothetical protein
MEKSSRNHDPQHQRLPAAHASGLSRGQDAEIKIPAHRVDERAQGESTVKYKYSCQLVSNIDNVGQGCF